MKLYIRLTLKFKMATKIHISQGLKPENFLNLDNSFNSTFSKSDNFHFKDMTEILYASIHFADKSFLLLDLYRNMTFENSTWWPFWSLRKNRNWKPSQNRMIGVGIFKLSSFSDMREQHTGIHIDRWNQNIILDFDFCLAVLNW